MKQEQLEAITYSQYTGWLYDVYLKIPKDLGFLTRDKAMELAKKERVLRRKEMKSIIQKILVKLSLIPCNAKHVYEDYDLALSLMHHLNKDILTKEDVDTARSEEFYNIYFKEALLEYQKFCFSHELDDLTKEERLAYEKQKKELFQKAIPPYGNFNFVEIKYN